MQNDCTAVSQEPGVDSQGASSSSSSYATISKAEASDLQTSKSAAMASSSRASNGLGRSHSFKAEPSAHAVPAELLNSSAKHAQRSAASVRTGSTAVHVRVSTGQDPSVAEPSAASYASSTTSATSADDLTELRRRRQSGNGASTSGQSTSSGWHPHDPEHLIVNGLGGAFLHPTHVFSPSRFVSGVIDSPFALACNP